MVPHPYSVFYNEAFCKFPRPIIQKGNRIMALNMSWTLFPGGRYIQRWKSVSLGELYEGEAIDSVWDGKVITRNKRGKIINIVVWKDGAKISEKCF